MQRRRFLSLTGVGCGALLAGCRLPGRLSGRDDLRAGSIDVALIEQNDEAVARVVARQVGDGSPHRGGVPDRYGLFRAGADSGLLRALAVGFVRKPSRYYRDRALLPRMEAAADHLLGLQHEDGTIDLLTTNFHSPPDTGFVLEWVAAATGVLRDHRTKVPEDAEALASLLDRLRRFVVAAAGALAVGGIHTPNHRWVVCMALARAHSLFPDPRFAARIDAWLGEGIDIDRDGQFTERSTSIYSPLTDRCLLTVARLLDRPELLEPVRKNLAMTLYYFHADGEVATEGSRRQDQYRRGAASPYYYPYRFMAQHDGDGRFAAAARWIEVTERRRLTRDAVFFAESEELRAPMPPSVSLPTSYEKHFRASDLVRIRRGAWSGTILGDNATFLSLHHGAAAVALRFAAAFFGKGQFVGENLRKDGDAWVLEQELRGPYWQPLRPDQRTGKNDWARVVRETRTPSEVQVLRSTARIAEHRDGGFDVTLEITGTAGVPVAVELGFRAGGSLAGPHLERLEHTAAAWVLAAGAGSYRLGDDRIVFGPGAATHRWTQLRGALPKLPGDSVYLTGVTPFQTKLSFRS